MPLPYLFELTDNEVTIILNSLRNSNLTIRETQFLTLGTQQHTGMDHACKTFYDLEQKIFHERKRQLEERAKDQK
jgi:hypothetical protein